MSAEQVMRVELTPIGRSGEPGGLSIERSSLSQAVCTSTAEMYAKVGFAPPWIGYLAHVDGHVVGTCAFKGPPVAGRVEIAYFTFPSFERRGWATCMARQLYALAKATAPDVLVFAFTAPTPSASTSVLARLGFRFVGAVQHAEDGMGWEWHEPLASTPARDLDAG
jgi:ribosomal-protein-alanine N-acetyltransferase